MESFRKHAGNEQGSTIAFVAVGMVMLLSMAALTIDLGMLFTAHEEAQRTADAAAHAGVIEFFKEPGDLDAAVPLARDSALFIAAQNTIRNQSVSNAIVSQQQIGDTLRVVFTEGIVDVIRSEQKVRVLVRRSGIPTWFARMFGVDTAAVSARSAAQVRSANQARCVKPFAVPDYWADYNNDGIVTNQTSSEYYARHDPDASQSPPQTGLGSAFRNVPGDPVVNDFGRQVTLRLGDQGVSSSIYFSWRLPEDPNLNQSKCPGGTSGQSEYRKNICHCNSNTITLGQTYETAPGATVGDTKFGLDDLIKQDPYAYWDPIAKEVKNSDPKFGHWTNSPRMAIVPLFDPRQLLSEGNVQTGTKPIVFNNFATVFIENRPAGQGNQDDIHGKFFPFVRGAGTSGPATGTLVRIIQIVE